MTDATSDVATDEKRSPQRQRSRSRQWCFRLTAIALAIVPFCLVEIGLRVAGVGHDTSFVIRSPHTTNQKVWNFNPAADLAYYGIEDVAGPESRPFELPKPAPVFRIVVVGGSTVAGFPYPSELALPRQLEAVLSEQFPTKQFEVLNAGITSINSSSEVDIVRQLLADCEPDLIIVHSGHNEFYGPGGSASTTSHFGPGFHQFMQGVRRQRTYQIAMAAIPRSKETHLVETLPSDIKIAHNGTLFSATMQRYESNLQKIIDLSQDAGVPLLVSTVPSNLRDLAPLAPPEGEDVHTRIREAEKHISYLEFDEAIRILRAAKSDYPQDALIQYREAQCLEKLNREQEAAEAYSLALDLDGCRFRAPSELLDVIRRVVKERNGIMFCDVAEELQRRSRFPAPGSDFFLEHVHYHYEGTWEVASILARAVTEQALGEVWHDDRMPDDQRRDELLGVTRLDHLAADSLTLIIFKAWPLNLSPARGAETASLQTRIAKTFSQIDSKERELFSTLGMTAMEQHLWHAMGERWLAVDIRQQALDSFRRHIARRPWEARGYLGAAAAYEAMGRSSESQSMRALATSCVRGHPANAPNN